MAGDDHAFGTVYVTVAEASLSSTATATPDTIVFEGSSQLSAAAKGGTGSYAYSWAPAASLNNGAIANPEASPTVTTKYTVIVTDVNTSETASAQVTVHVKDAPPTPIACFTWTPTSPTPLQTVTFDAACSHGNIREYRWWFIVITGDPVFIQNDPQTSITFGLAGTFKVKLEVVEIGTGATDSIVQEILLGN
jgi:PKD repeat protein